MGKCICTSKTKEDMFEIEVASDYNLTKVKGRKKKY